MTTTKKKICRTDYQKFYEENILRPYWSMISDDPERPDYNDARYFNFLGYYNNDAWVHAVFTRLSRIYSVFDVDFFPGTVGAEINECMRQFGIKDREPGEQP